ncbi:CynX/NimT family MFS transporter [Bradyrhizobium sp.]|uniref:MFS transporter n=1 Tax=Bradyrhizobium sp. TaxID=376 RepID=UPI002E040519|nr:MFS transporter [Bradyrhizobium sp.]
MRNRWGILAVLFVVRLTMGFQFQSVAAVAPLLIGDFGVGLADIGVLIGLYFIPGVALALPGGAIGQKFGDKTTVAGALLLMLAGTLAMALSVSWSVQIAGRLVAGAGGVLLNVQMTKMLTDWFADREIATSMAIFVNSWPAGIAISLLTLPAIGAAYGVSAVYLAVAAMIGCGTVLFAALYRAPPNHAVAAVATARLDRNTFIAVIAAALIWSLYNVGFATIFSFGPSMLVEGGWSITAAGSTISIVLWLTVFSVATGGFLADRIERPESIIVAGCIVFAMLMILLPRSGSVVTVTVALGLVCGLPAGSIMSLPARVLTPGTRAIGIGSFFTVYYAGMMLGPVLAGGFARWAGSAGAALDFGAAMILLCPIILWGFNRIPVAVLRPA